MVSKAALKSMEMTMVDLSESEERRLWCRSEVLVEWWGRRLMSIEI